MEVPLLQLVGISKSFGGQRALNDVSFDVRKGEVHALVGENGAGKSTLMKAMAGAQPADSGDILIDGNVVHVSTPQTAIDLGINLIYQEFQLAPHLTIADNIFLGQELRGRLPGTIDSKGQLDQSNKILADLGAGFSADRLVSGLSVAQQQIVEIAKALRRKSRIIAMDEPSATLTGHDLEKLWERIKLLTASGVSIVYISHRLEEIFAIADRVTVLRDGQVVGTRDIKDVDTNQLVAMMVGRSLENVFPQSDHQVELKTEPLLELRDLTVGTKLKNISLTVRPGEIVALAGLVGAGRTEIARAIFGADAVTSGQIIWKGKLAKFRNPGDAIRAGIGFVTEDRKREGLMLLRPIKENVSEPSIELGLLARLGVILSAKERQDCIDETKKLSVKAKSIDQNVGELSGGNQQKTLIARWLMTGCKLLILDEPTRGVDIGAKREIYEQMRAITDHGAAILMISSELPEVLGMADRIYVVRDGRISGEVSATGATQESVMSLAVA